ncbi:MAG: LysR substrate-binding domain-containing protein [Ruthenibacterium sp.]
MLDYRIRTFLTLYETLNYRRTGEALGLSQPAVGHQVHTLEDEYGCRLFIYDGRRLSPTPQADRLAEYARAAVYNQQQLLAALRADGARTVRVGATKTIGEYVAAEAFSRYAQRTQGGFCVTVDNTETLLHMLEREELDFALVEGAFDKSRYGYALYQRAPFVGMCHAKHPFAGRTVSMEQLAGQSVVLRENGSGTRAIFERALAERGYSTAMLRRVICASSFPLIVRFVREGAGVTFAYAAVANGQKGISFFHLEGMPESREFNVVYLKGTHVQRLVRNVLGPAAPALAP